MIKGIVVGEERTGGRPPRPHTKGRCVSGQQQQLARAASQRMACVIFFVRSSNFFSILSLPM